MDIKDDVTIQSWDGTWTYRPKVLVTPQTPEDIVEIVKSVVRFPSPVRPAGSMHSTARMNGDDGGTMVDMKAMNRILKFGEDTVTVEGGVSLSDRVQRSEGARPAISRHDRDRQRDPRRHGHRCHQGLAPSPANMGRSAPM